MRRAIGKAARADPVILKFSHVVSPDAPKGKAAVLFKQLAEKYTDSKVSVEVYPRHCFLPSGRFRRRHC